MRIREVGQTIEERRHITRDSWVGIVTPCSPKVASAIEDNEIFKTKLFQPRRHGKASKASADNNDMVACQRRDLLEGSMIFSESVVVV